MKELMKTINILEKFLGRELGNDVQIMLLGILSLVIIVLIGWLIFSIFHIKSIEKILHHKLNNKEYKDVIDLAHEFIEKKKKKKKHETLMVLYYLACAYENTEHYTNAIKFYEEVLLQHPKKDKFYRNLLIKMARIYEKQNKTKEAMAHYIMTLDSDEYNIEALYGIGKLHFFSGNTKRSLDYFEKILLKKPNLLDARKFYGKALLDTGFYQVALSQFEFIIKYFPDDPEVYYLKAKTEENLKKYNEAIKTYKILVKKDFNEEKMLEKTTPLNIFDIKEEVKLTIVRLLIKLKKYDEGLTYISDFLSMPGKDETKLELLYLYGNILWNKGEEFQALKNFERIYMMKPDFKDVALFYDRYKKILPHTYLSNYFTTSEESNFESICKKILGKQIFNLIYKSGDFYVFTKGPFAVIFYRHIEPIPFSKLTDMEVIINTQSIPISNVEIYSISGVREDAYNHFLLKKSHLIEANEFIKTIRELF